MKNKDSRVVDELFKQFVLNGHSEEASSLLRGLKAVIGLIEQLTTLLVPVAATLWHPVDKGVQVLLGEVVELREL